MRIKQPMRDKLKNAAKATAFLAVLAFTWAALEQFAEWLDNL